MSTNEQTLASALCALIGALQDSDFAADFEDEISDAIATLEACGHDADMVSDESRSNGPRY